MKKRDWKARCAALEARIAELDAPPPTPAEQLAARVRDALWAPVECPQPAGPAYIVGEPGPEIYSFSVSPQTGEQQVCALLDAVCSLGSYTHFTAWLNRQDATMRNRDPGTLAKCFLVQTIGDATWRELLFEYAVVPRPGGNRGSRHQ